MNVMSFADTTPIVPTRASDPSNVPGVELVDISVRFGSLTVVSHVNLSIKAGEFFTLLGPSGCGKTTLLRAIAGFYRQSEGSISIGGSAVDDTPAYRRDTGMVFQNYAIFPHLNVWGNVAYGLASRKISGAAAAQRISETLEMVDLKGYEKRMPKQLSGGQQQRVVIARAIAIRPRVLLMDEPLANLDAKLRVRLRNDLKTLQRSLGITTIYVTHDQEEALSLSDRLAVISGGEVLQVGTPEDVYARPGTLRVAEFIGEGNFLRGHATGEGGRTAVVLRSCATIAAAGPGSDCRGEVWVGFRPQDVSLHPVAETSSGIVGTLRARTYLGSYVSYAIDCGLDQPISVQVVATAVPEGMQVGSQVALHVAPAQVMIFPGDDKAVEL